MAASFTDIVASARSAERALEDLRVALEQHDRWFVLTGAGVSTESGIPGYRDDDGRWQRSSPIMLQEFLTSETARQRYWARSMAGWPIVTAARPNAAHHVLARLEADGVVQTLVTQNVDGLHQRAGSSQVIELHGSIDHVQCLDCGIGYDRAAIQARMERDNPGRVGVPATTAPDGDADLEFASLAAFRLPHCERCSGLLKPSVVFFGEGVPKARVAAAFVALESAQAVLVVGSSLMVYSGYRFCERAADLGKPIFAINRGRTRADHLFRLKVERSCAEALSFLLTGVRGGRSNASVQPT